MIIKQCKLLFLFLFQLKKSGKMGGEEVGKGGMSGCSLVPPPLPKLNPIGLSLSSLLFSEYVLVSRM